MSEKIFDLFIVSLLISAQALWLCLLQGMVVELWTSVVSLLVS